MLACIEASWRRIVFRSTQRCVSWLNTWLLFVSRFHTWLFLWWFHILLVVFLDITVVLSGKASVSHEGPCHPTGKVRQPSVHAWHFSRCLVLQRYEERQTKAPYAGGTRRGYGLV